MAFNCLDGRHNGWVYTRDGNSVTAIQMAHVNAWKIDGTTGTLSVYMRGGVTVTMTAMDPLACARLLGAPIGFSLRVYLSQPCVVKSLNLTTPRPRLMQWLCIAALLLAILLPMLACSAALHRWVL